MALSPYRFSLDDTPATNVLGRTRTGLSSVTAGAASGGEGYRKSALAPGSRGYMAASFGNAPQTGYVTPTQTATVTVTPTVPPPPVAPTVAPAAPVGPPAGDQNDNNSHGEGGGAGGGNTGGPEGFDNGGPPGNLSDLGLTGVDVGRGLGGVVGGVLGPIGAIGGAYLGGKLADYLGLGGAIGGTGKGDIANDAKDQTEAPNPLGGGDPSAAGGGFGGGAKGGDMGNDAKGGDPAEGGSDGGTDAGGGGGGGGGGGNSEAEANAEPGGMGFARGGRVTGDRLMKGMPMDNKPKSSPMDNKPKGLGDVKAGGNAPKGNFMGAYSKGGAVCPPGYQAGGPVDAVAGPNPPGADDGYAALDQGEFVVRKDQAQRPDYAPILSQINAGTYPADGTAAHEGMESPGMEMAGGDDGDDGQGLALGQGNYPPSGGQGVTPDDMMQRLATLPPEQRQALQQAAADPMLLGALFGLLGPAFMQVLAMVGQAPAPSPMPGMMSMPPDVAGRRPMGGGLSSVNA